MIINKKSSKEQCGYYADIEFTCDNHFSVRDWHGDRTIMVNTITFFHLTDGHAVFAVDKKQAICVGSIARGIALTLDETVQ